MVVPVSTAAEDALESNMVLLNIVRAVEEELGISFEPSELSATWLRWPTFDSLSHMRILMNVEIRCGFELDFDELIACLTVSELHTEIVGRYISPNMR